MKKTLLISALLLSMPAVSNAACKAGQLNGVWEGTINNASGGIGICSIVIQGNKLAARSFCSNEYGDNVPLTNSQVKKRLGQCGTEVYFRFSGEPHSATLTMDRQVTVAVGLFASQWSNNLGTISLVKK